MDWTPQRVRGAVLDGWHDVAANGASIVETNKEIIVTSTQDEVEKFVKRGQNNMADDDVGEVGGRTSMQRLP